MSAITIITILEPLTLEEESERLRLERQVKQEFYKAGLALQKLRDRKLYRSTHNSFREYCQDRFGFTKRSAYYLIDAVKVVDNLQKGEPLVHLLPTSERQCRSLKSLQPEQQREVWNQAVAKANGKVPSGKIVTEIVNQLKKKSDDSKKDLQKQEMVDKNGKVSTPSEGVNYVRGVGIEWYVRVDEETWNKLNKYAEKIGTATLSSAINLLLESAAVKP